MNSTTNGVNCELESVDLLYTFVDTAKYLDNFLYVCHITFSIIGIPLNLSLIGAILFFKRLHLSQNFTWLGIGISNVGLLAAHLTENVSVRWMCSSWTRSLSTWLVILSIAFQTLNFAATVMERNICRTYPDWHKGNLTPLVMIIGQLSFLLLFYAAGLLNFNLVLGESLLSQESSQWNFQFIGSFIMGVLPICLTSQLGIMRNRINRHYPSIEIIHIKSTNNAESNEEQQQDVEKNEYYRSFFVLIGKNRVSLLELEAARCIYFIGKLYLAFMTPIFILFVATSVCLQISSSNAAGYDDVCSSLIQVYYYTVGLLNCIHSSIANPISFALLSNDILSVFVSRSNQDYV